MNPLRHVAFIMDGNGRWGLKNKGCDENEKKSHEKNIQNITDKHISIIDDKVVSKEKEIMTI